MISEDDEPRVCMRGRVHYISVEICLLILSEGV